MKNKIIGLMAVVMAVVMIAPAMADTYISVDVNAAGTSNIWEQLQTGHVFEEEIINNVVGTMKLHKDAFTTPSTHPTQGGMELEFNKNLKTTGNTTFYEGLKIGGLNWQKNGGWHVETPKNVGTGYIKETITNLGNLSVEKQVYSSGDWHLYEGKEVKGEGITTLEKRVVWWTNTKNPGPDDRTEVYMNLDFDSKTNPTTFDYVGTHTDGKTPQQYKFSKWPSNKNKVNIADFHIGTDEKFKFNQKVHFNWDLW